MLLQDVISVKPQVPLAAWLQVVKFRSPSSIWVFAWRGWREFLDALGQCVPNLVVNALPLLRGISTCLARSFGRMGRAPAWAWAPSHRPAGSPFEPAATDSCAVREENEMAGAGTNARRGRSSTV